MSIEVAVLDLGTNTFHLLIAGIDRAGMPKVRTRRQIPVKLGENGISRGELSQSAVARAISAINEIKEIIASNKINEVHIYATSAFRTTRNAGKLVKYIESALNSRVTIIDGKKEAELIYLGARWVIDIDEVPYLLLDIGGGSVEFIVADHNDILYLESAEIGAARLVEQFHRTDPIDDKDIEKMHRYLDKELKPILKKIQSFHPLVMVGAAGSFETLAEIDIRYVKKQTPKDLPDVYELDMQRFDEMAEKMIRSTREELFQIRGMAPFRVNMIVVAVVLIRYLVKKLNIQKLIFSDFAIKEGILWEVLGKKRS